MELATTNTFSQRLREFLLPKFFSALIAALAIIFGLAQTASALNVESEVAAALEVSADIQLTDGTVICNAQKQPRVAHQGILQEAKYATALFKKERSTVQQKIKAALKKSKGKKTKAVKALELRSKNLNKLITKVTSRSKACSKGKFGSVSGGNGGFAALSGLSLSGTNPSPNAQGEIVVSELPQTATGTYILQLTGQGFVQGQALHVLINNQRLLSVNHIVLDANTIELHIQHPIRLDAEFTVVQATGLGLILSNPLSVVFSKGSTVGQIGDHVARLEHETPSNVSTYVIDANIPVPAGTFTESDMLAGVSPFALQQNGNFIPMQASGITRYPNNEFDLVNVSAEVTTQPGSAISGFDVFLANTQLTPWPSAVQDVPQLLAASSLSLPAELEAVFGASGGLIAEGEDVFGHLYRCDLGHNQAGPIKLFSYGPSKIVYRVFCMLTPVSPVAGSSGTLPHLAGVFAYVNLINGREAARVNFVVSNAIAGAPLHAGDTKAQAFNDLYFKSLRIKAASALGVQYTWRTPVTVDASSSAGTTRIDLFPTRSDGKMHFIATRRTASFEVNLHTQSPAGINDANVLREYQDIAFAAEGQSSTNPNLKLYSPHNIATARMGIAAGIPWPTLYHLNTSNIRTSLTSAYNTLNNFVLSGKCQINHKDELMTSGGNSQCGFKQRRYYCDYPFIGGESLSNSIAVLIPNPANPSVCIPDPAVPPPVATASQSPYSVPYGVKYGGMTSGSEIFVGGRGFDVWASRSRNGIRQLVLYMTLGLQRQEFLHMLSGDRFSPVDAVRQSAAGSYIPVRAFGGYDPSYCSVCDSLFGFNSSPAAQSSYVMAHNLVPPYQSNVEHQVSDEQHLIRSINGIYAVLQLAGLAHPRAFDEALSMGYYSYFTNPHLPLQYQGSSPAWVGGALQALRRNQPSVGVAQGRALAHTQSARVMAAALDPTFKSFMEPYFQFYARDLMYWSQMWTGLLHFSNNYAKASPLGRCNTSISRENSFLQVANQATLSRILDGVASGHANELRTVISGLGSSLLIQNLVAPQNSWMAPFSNVMFSSEADPFTPFADWNAVPANCKTDAMNSGPGAGEQNFLHAIADAAVPSPQLWQQLKAYHGKSHNAPTTLGKLQQLGLYSLQSTNDVMNLGYCQVLEADQPGYCG